MIVETPDGRSRLTCDNGCGAELPSAETVPGTWETLSSDPSRPDAHLCPRCSARRAAGALAGTGGRYVSCTRCGAMRWREHEAWVVAGPDEGLSDGIEATLARHGRDLLCELCFEALFGRPEVSGPD